MRSLSLAESIRQYGLATLAAAGIATGSAIAQSTSEPDGMPVYRQQKNSFFQNPFSTGYQRIWNMARSQKPAETPATMPEVTTTPLPVTTHDRPVESVAPRKPAKTGRGIFNRFARTGSPTRSTSSRKPTATKTVASRNGKPSPEHASDRVIHVDDVNEGTPQVGTIYEVNQPHPEIVKSLAEGEQVVKVTERVIGVYRDGKLVILPDGVPSNDAAAPQRHEVLKPTNRKTEVDPWFGDTVDVPTEEVQAFEDPDALPESLPPQSYDAMPILPTLPPREESDHVIPASTSAEATRMIYVPVDANGQVLVPTQYVPVQVIATPQPRVPVNAPPAQPPKPVSAEVQKKYQPSWR